jgi:hypothetical protein
VLLVVGIVVVLRIAKVIRKKAKKWKTCMIAPTLRR